MRLIAWLLTVLVLAGLVTSAPPSRGMLHAAMAMTHDGAPGAQTEAPADKSPCPMGHCRDGAPSQHDCAIGLGVCGAAIPAEAPPFLRTAGHAARVPLGIASSMTLALAPSDPPPPRSSAVRL